MRPLLLVPLLLALSSCSTPPIHEHVETIKNGRDVTYVYYVGKAQYKAYYYHDGVLVRTEMIP